MSYLIISFKRFSSLSFPALGFSQDVCQQELWRTRSCNKCVGHSSIFPLHALLWQTLRNHLFGRNWLSSKQRGQRFSVSTRQWNQRPKNQQNQPEPEPKTQEECPITKIKPVEAEEKNLRNVPVKTEPGEAEEKNLRNVPVKTEPGEVEEKNLRNVPVKTEPVKVEEKNMRNVPCAKAESAEETGAKEPDENKRKPTEQKSSQATKKRRTKKESAQELRDLEDRLIQDHKFTHNVDFQKEHRSRHMMPRKGHWEDFLLKFKDAKAMTCEACRACRDKLGGVPCEEEEIPVLAACEEVAAPIEEKEMPRKRGRPRADQEWIGLPAWIEKHRAGLYQQLPEEDGCTTGWLCRICNIELNFFRDGLTYLLKHESGNGHKSRAALMKGGLLPAGPSVEANRIVPCSGALVSNKNLVPFLFAIKESIAIWLQGGSPSVKGSCPMLNEVSFAFAEDDVMFRHQKCKGEDSPGLCHLCFQASRNTHLTKEIQKWAWRLDLVDLCHHFLLGTSEEVTQQQERISARDYFQKEHHGAEMARLMKLSPMDAAARVRSQILSIQKSKRNPALQALVETRLADARGLTCQSMEKNVMMTLLSKFQGAVERGECHKSDFELASMIASGKLKNEPLIEALFRSSMAKLSKVERGCTQRPNSSKFFNPDLALDLVVVLGRSKATEDFLQFLGDVGWCWMMLDVKIKCAIWKKVQQ